MTSLAHHQAHHSALAMISLRCQIFAPAELQHFFATRFALHRLIAQRGHQDADVLIRLSRLAEGNPALGPLLATMSKGASAQ